MMIVGKINVWPLCLSQLSLIFDLTRKLKHDMIILSHVKNEISYVLSTNLGKNNTKSLA